MKNPLPFLEDGSQLENIQNFNNLYNNTTTEKQKLSLIFDIVFEVMHKDKEDGLFFIKHILDTFCDDKFNAGHKLIIKFASKAYKDHPIIAESRQKLCDVYKTSLNL